MTSPVLPQFTLRRGDRGSAVRLLQRRLGMPDYTPDEFGPRTEALVREAQQALGLQVDGVAGPATLRALRIPIRLGIDVSHHQGAIDWRVVHASGVRWVAIKATEGATFVDKRWRENATAARALGMEVWSYHFAVPGEDDAREEAAHFVATLQQVPGASQRTVLDLEVDPADLTVAELEKWVLAFSSAVQTLTGSAPMLYTMPGFLRHQLGGGRRLAETGLRLWLSHIASRPTSDLGAWASWDVWQWSWRGSVPGITGHVDLNWVLPSVSAVVPWRADERLLAEFEAEVTTPGGIDAAPLDDVPVIQRNDCAEEPVAAPAPAQKPNAEPKPKAPAAPAPKAEPKPKATPAPKAEPKPQAAPKSTPAVEPQPAKRRQASADLAAVPPAR